MKNCYFKIFVSFQYFPGDSIEDNQGKVLLHNEHSILSILQDTPGVVRHHGLFKESQRIILVLSCVYKHDYDQEKKCQVSAICYHSRSTCTVYNCTSL